MKTWIAYNGTRPLGEVTAPSEELAIETAAELYGVLRSEVVLEDPARAKRLRKIANHKPNLEDYLYG